MFLYLGFAREASNGTGFATFELNQDPRPWRLSNGLPIPCRTTGDILITFGRHGNTDQIGVERWTTTASDNGCATSGTLQPDTKLSNDDLQASFNHGSINNYLPGA